MQEKLLVQSCASAADPEYRAQMVKFNGDAIPFLEFFTKEGIRVLQKDVVNSCHGNNALTARLAADVQGLADQGHKIVSIQSGGLYFAKPSLEAAQMPTVPVISVPLNGGYFNGEDAFLAPSVPSGTAVIGGVGMGRYDTAARVAKEILAREFEGVYVFNANDRLMKRLEELGVPVIGESMHDAVNGLMLYLMRDDQDYLNGQDYMNVRHIDGNVALTVFSFPKSAQTLDAMQFCDGLGNSVFVRGEENLAYFAAKIMSSYNRKAFYALKAAAEKKAASYEDRRIDMDSFGRL